MDVNKARILTNNTDIEDAIFVAEKSNNRSKWLAVKLLDIRNVVFNERKSLLSILIAGKNRLNINGIF